MTFYKTLAGSGEIQGISKYIIIACDHIFHILVDGNFWVFVFCILSGYFAGKKKIESTRELFVAIMLRYIRFVIPVFFTNIFAFGIQETIGYHTQEWAKYIGSTWVAQGYAEKRSLFNAFYSALLLTHDFNGSFWVIRPIFIGSCGIYFYRFMKAQIEVQRYRYMPEAGVLCLFSCVFVIVPLYEKFYHAAICLVGGVLLKAIWEEINIPEEVHWLPCTTFVLCIMALNVYPYMGVKERSLTAFLFCIACNYVGKVRHFLEIGKLEKVNHLSFGIFAVHGPILFSFCIILQYWLADKVPYVGAVLINFIVSTSVVLLFSATYHNIAERFLNVIIAHLKRLHSDKKIYRERI
ncbi:hypothetical protein NSB25_09305 [Acetatifactor muris]|nr:hypothetical protein [Acetatifactor muris]MCR2047475.1 hypothetical protein [Acetatifactor muris]